MASREVLLQGEREAAEGKERTEMGEGGGEYRKSITPQKNS